MTQFIHIISFDIPYPANYGGVIDVFHKIRSLHNQGVEIILHCFQYNQRTASKDLENLCHKVYYYKRNTSLIKQISLLPYTVISRKNKNLINNLLKDNHPILFEGLISCYYLSDHRLKNRIKIYRESNIEHDYYRALAKATKNPVSKLFLLIEAFKLKLFEKTIQHADYSFVVSVSDAKQLRERYPNNHIAFMPSFHPNDKLNSLTGQSEYVLYNGNLSVAENELAVDYLCKEVFPYLNYKCIVAGLNPSLKLQSTIKSSQNIELIANPNDEEMNSLIKNAQVHLLVTMQGTGLKLKLLNTLFAGKHLLVNDLMLEGSGLDELCHIGNSPEEQIELCKRLMQKPFTEEDLKNRQKRLFPRYSNSANAEILKSLL